MVQNIEDAHFLPEAILQQLPGGLIIFPGLVNAHDHLEFNDFPLLANRRYDDYIEWGDDIHIHHRDVIQEVIKTDKRVRMFRGILKNLLNGFTKVVHHGFDHREVVGFTKYPLWTDYQYVHAPATDPYWKLKINIPWRRPFMIHAGEGVSQRVRKEIGQVLKANLLGRRIIGIHAIGITPEEAGGFHGIVWCPASNQALYGTTMDAQSLKGTTSLLFGTDSTVSASANVWDHFQLIIQQGWMDPGQLLELLQQTRSFFNASPLQKDWVIARRKAATPIQSFFELSPADLMLVVIDGQTWLCDDALPIGLRPPGGGRIAVGSTRKWIPEELYRECGLTTANHWFSEK